jgi:hypothetical protein
MERTLHSSHGAPLARQLAQLKLISRLLAHELHAQGGSKTITLSREEVNEIQTSIDLFIEEVGRRQGSTSHAVAETTLVSPRNN